MSSFESTWDTGDYRPVKVLMTFLLVIGGFMLGNFPILILYPLDRGKTMTDLVSYFGFTRLFILQMIPFFFGVIGFFLSARFIHKVTLITWFTTRPKIDFNRILFSLNGGRFLPRVYCLVFVFLFKCFLKNYCSEDFCFKAWLNAQNLSFSLLY